MQHSSTRTTSEEDDILSSFQEDCTTVPTPAPILSNIGLSAEKDTAHTIKTKTTMKDTFMPPPDHQAFPLHLKYPEEGYNKVLVDSLYEGSLLLTWSKKVT